MIREPTSMVIDVETTMKCPVGKSKSNPFWPENKIVMYGGLLINKEHTSVGVQPPDRVSNILTDTSLKDSLLIGHNIAFDIHYCLKAGSLTQAQLGQIQIWDTQLAEYLLSGQQYIFPSLDECAARRGGGLNDTRVSDMFAAGKGADEVPPAMLEEYLKADVENTNKVFISQFAEAMDKGMLALLWSQMDARLATIEMTYNGMAMDKKFLEEGAKKLEGELKALEHGLSLRALTCTGYTLDATSPKQLSTILFGGIRKEVTKEVVGTYKNGNPKVVNVHRDRKVEGYGLKAHSDWKNSNGYSTSDEVLESLIADLRPYSSDRRLTDARIFMEDVQSYREKQKQLSTYFDGLNAAIMPDGFIHPTLNHTATKTGRLSGSEPNMQNQPKESVGEVKKAFVSRWGKDGVILDADYGQLEMVMLAVLSKDSQLLADIERGVDTHSALFIQLHHREPTESERWSFKRCTFALIYGGGAKALAAQGKTTEVEAKNFMKVFFRRYPRVKEWHDEVYASIKAGRIYDGSKDAKTGYPVGKSTYNSPFSGRRYVFTEYANSPEVQRWRGETCSFSPQETKNWPVQGGATADIVPLILGKLFRVLRDNPRLADLCLMIMTVHDSVLFDVHKDVLEEAIRAIRSTMEAAPAYIKDTFGYTFPLKLKVGLSYGPNWQEQVAHKGVV